MAATPPLKTELADTYPNPSNAVFRTGIGRLWESVFGTGSQFAAWTTQSVSVAPSTGAFSDAVGLIHFVKTGRTVLFQLVVTVNANGTGAGTILVTLPWVAALEHSFAGRESQATGQAVIGTSAANSNILTLFKYDNSYPGGESRRISIGGVLQATA